MTDYHNTSGYPAATYSQDTTAVNPNHGGIAAIESTLPPDADINGNCMPSSNGNAASSVTNYANVMRNGGMIIMKDPSGKQIMGTLDPERSRPNMPVVMKLYG